MVTNIEEAQKKYKVQLDIIDEFRKNLIELGFEVEVKDEFELGGEWKIYLSTQEIAEFAWNVPYYLSFNPSVSQKEQAFDIDNIKNEDYWRSIVDDVLLSIEGIKNLKE